MKAYFDDKRELCIEAENNTEMVALVAWIGTENATIIKPNEHLKVQATATVSPVN